jgi:hypothetical protein
MLPQGNDNQTVIEVDASVQPHKHYASDIINIQSRLDGVLSQIKGRVPTEGDTLEKLYNLLISSTVEIIVPNIEARDALDIQNTFTNVFVLGDDSWELYKATSIGTNASFVKLSDSTIINNIIGADVLTKNMLPTGNISNSDQLVLGNDSRLMDSRYPLPHKHNISSLTGVDSLIDTKINSKLSNVNVGVLSINSKTGDVDIQKTDVGLGNVDNTADINKPLSTAQIAELNRKIDVKYFPKFTTASETELVLGSDPRLSDSRYPKQHTHVLQDINNFSSSLQNILVNLFDVTDITVNSINGRKGAVSLTATDVGLKYVDNTPDIDKPISRPQQAELNLKINKSLLPVANIAEYDQLVMGSDPRLNNARHPLPHTTDSITDFNESVTALSKSVFGALVNLDELKVADIPSLVPGTYSKITINSKGQVTEGINTSSIRDLGIEDVYTKPELDLKLSRFDIDNPTTPGSFVTVNEFGKIPDVVLPDAIQTFTHTGYFPHIGSKNALYVDESHNTLYAFTGTEYVPVSTQQETNSIDLPKFASVATSGDYNDLSNIPNLAKVASTANYYDLNDIPALSKVASSGDYRDLTHRPTFAKITTTGSYNDLNDRPTFQDVALSGSYLDLHNRPDFTTVAYTGNYNDLTEIPDLNQFITKTDSVFTQTKTLNFVGYLKPVTGSSRWYPERNITLLYAYLTVSEPSSNNILCDLNMNSSSISNITMVVPQNKFKSIRYDFNVNVSEDDYLTLDIIQAVDGRNLALTIVYR